MNFYLKDKLAKNGFFNSIYKSERKYKTGNFIYLKNN